MPRRAIPRTFRAVGLSDTVDATNAFPGAMQVLQNLVPSPSTPRMFVPRPAATSATTFSSGFTTPAQIEALLVLGAFAYGMIATADFTGKSVPFCFHLLDGTFHTISIPRGTTALPTTQAATGDWTPPTVDVIGSRIVFTHPGFAGGAVKFGWLDISGFSDATHTGNTNSSNQITSLSANVLLAGWQPGMTITGTNIPANTTILSIASGGLSLTLSQAATGTTAGVTLTVAGGTQAAPLWDAGDCNLNPLAATPVAVKNFNGRAYFAVPGAGMAYSDSGFPCTRTNATQAITPNNGLDITAFGGLPYSQTTGGPLQALIAFQGDSQMLSVTGDAALSNLATNNVGVGVGTNAPNTIAQTPFGLMFVAPDGVRYVNFLGSVSDPVGANGKGVNVPFLNSLSPTRMAASYNQNVYRVSVQNGAVSGQPTQEYWLDFSLKIWTGPHTFPAALIQPFQAATGSVQGHGFIMVASGINAELWESDVAPSTSSTYTENGTLLSWAWKTSLMPDTQGLTENATIDSTLGLAIPDSSQVTIVASNEIGTVLDQRTIMGSGDLSTWGTLVWGAGNWNAQTSNFRQYEIAWSTTLVYKQMQLQLTGASISGFALGNFYFSYEPLGYVTQSTGAFV